MTLRVVRAKPKAQMVALQPEMRVRDEVVAFKGDLHHSHGRGGSMNKLPATILDRLGGSVTC